MTTVNPRVGKRQFARAARSVARCRVDFVEVHDYLAARRPYGLPAASATRGLPTKSLAASGTGAELLAGDLAAVERKLLETIVSREPRLGEIAQHLIGSGGKRIRPLVAMGVFRACGGDDARDMVDVAVALELIHSATLLHDDIIDGSDYRRGRVSAYRQFGSADTLVAGDFLFSKAFELCGRFEETIVRWAAEACIALTEGEIMQGRFRRNPAVTIADYWEIIDRKTACLFQQGARVAAHLAGASRYRVETLARSGQAIGMTFQVIDDLLDVEGEAATTGKPVGIDIRDGNPSLPILIGMEEDARVAEIWRSEAPTDDEVAEAIERIRASSAPDRVREEARRFMESAARELATLPDTPYRETLEGLVAELEERAL